MHGNRVERQRARLSAKVTLQTEPARNQGYRTCYLACLALLTAQVRWPVRLKLVRRGVAGCRRTKTACSVWPSDSGRAPAMAMATSAAAIVATQNRDGNNVDETEQVPGAASMEKGPPARASAGVV